MNRRSNDTMQQQMTDAAADNSVTCGHAYLCSRLQSKQRKSLDKFTTIIIIIMIDKRWSHSLTKQNVFKEQNDIRLRQRSICNTNQASFLIRKCLLHNY